MSYVSFQGPGFFRISFKQLQKTGLGACSAPATQQLYGGKQSVQILQILQKILRPAGGPAAYGNRLSCLQMGKPQTGNLSGIKGKSAQRPECLAKLAAKQSQSFPQQQNIGIVRYIAAGGA